jgi:hypothetical protein
MAMHSQNMNRSGDLRVDDHGQFPESEVFLNYLHSDEYSQTTGSARILDLFANDTQYQSFYEEDIHSRLPDSHQGAGYNGKPCQQMNTKLPNL